MKKLSAILMLFAIVCSGCSLRQNVDIYSWNNADHLEVLAAKELRKYIYQCTGSLAEISMDVKKPFVGGKQIIICSRNSVHAIPDIIDRTLKEEITNLHEEEFLIMSLDRKILLIAGGSELATLYGVYDFVESLGVRYYLHGDVIPDKNVDFEIPLVNIKKKPLFSIRGIQPFHDFPEGPDWWSADDYKSILTQLVKLKMNFIGLHTYPEGLHGPEPTVWIGIQEDINPDGTVNWSYPARYFTTMGDEDWGYIRKSTSDYLFGTSQLYDRNNYRASCMENFSHFPRIATRKHDNGYVPEKTDYLLKTSQEWNELFNTMGTFLNDVFTEAKYLGISTCIGTETDLTIPQNVRERLKSRGINPDTDEARLLIYKGIFERIQRTHPLDYYWLWTPENWLWGSGNSLDQANYTVKDINTAHQASKILNTPFRLATCGWTLGPVQDRSMYDKIMPDSIILSCINGRVGFDPVDPSFSKIEERSKWAIPWLEDDGAMISPQFWAGRLRRDAADALAYGCDGLIGLHWRTRIIGPNISALAKAAWEQKDWNPFINKAMNFDQALDNSLNDIRDLPINDFYMDWATSQFGDNASEEIANIFINIDGGQRTVGRSKQSNLPRPSSWKYGPGGMEVDSISWKDRKMDYQFVNEFDSYRDHIQGKGNRARYDYWLNQFKYLRETGEFACLIGEMERLMTQINESDDNVEQKRLVRELAIPIREQQVETFKNMNAFLSNSVTTKGGLGNVTNLQQHNMFIYITKPGLDLEEIIGERLPETCWPVDEYVLENRVIVTTARTLYHADEEINVEVIVTGNEEPDAVRIFWKQMDEKKYNEESLKLKARRIYIKNLKIEEGVQDIEYYIEAIVGTETVYWPSTAPGLNHVVVIN